VLGKRAITVSLPGPVVLAAGFLTQSIGRLRGRAPALSLDKARGTLSSGWWCSDAKAIAELGYRPEFPLERGLEQTVRWLRDNGVL
jgi:nucleoside-diphosphate-sugar epimerase